MGVEHLLLLVVGQRMRDRASVAERIVESGEPVDECGVSLEQLRELLGRQLPR